MLLDYSFSGDDGERQRQSQSVAEVGEWPHGSPVVNADGWTCLTLLLLHEAVADVSTDAAIGSYFSVAHGRCVAVVGVGRRGSNGCYRRRSAGVSLGSNMHGRGGERIKHGHGIGSEIFSFVAKVSQSQGSLRVNNVDLDIG